MPLQVYQVAFILDKKIILTKQSQIKEGFIASIFTRLKEVTDYIDECLWSLEVIIPVTKLGQKISLELKPFINKADYKLSDKEPIFIIPSSSDHHLAKIPLILFKNQFFMPERASLNEEEKEEIILRVKKNVYSQEVELIKLREEIQNIEAALDCRKNNIKRIPIADDVKSLVWTRDQGCCINCGSSNNLHFDHIIPVSKGGSNYHSNIQILCQKCNLQKSDKIAPGII